jgi:hypothetical protein
MAGAPATIGGLLGVGNKYGPKRRDGLRKHPMADLYQIGGGRPAASPIARHRRRSYAG